MASLVVRPVPLLRYTTQVGLPTYYPLMIINKASLHCHETQSHVVCISLAHVL